ncbi:MAG TPA: HPr(Ser) kinase/phosphatase [bacterium]|nr:HPr(Ser) kinase/phosphatase [bacterium]
MNYITLKDFFEDNKIKFGMSVLAGADMLSKKKIIVPDINRPGLALAGFFDYFPYERLQVFGKTEFTYIKKSGSRRAAGIFSDFFEKKVCCAIISRNLKPPEGFLSCAKKYSVPVLASSLMTTKLISSSLIYLEKKLAPKTSVHGTFVDVYGIGTILAGRSGIGKSEVSLELVKRGHRLVADDLIELSKTDDDALTGRGLNVVRHHMEIRGVGIIDIKNIFGIGAIRDSQKLELIINLEEWEKGKDYERLGMDDSFEEILGVKVPVIIMPVKPGRNLSVIIEAAAMTQRLKAGGYNPARELNKNIIKWMKGRGDDFQAE